MTDTEERIAKRHRVQCILCNREYDREDTDSYRLLGVFENYCLCQDCLCRDRLGWDSAE